MSVPRFDGTYHNALDGKGRVAIPAKHRSVLKGDQNVMVTYHFVPPNPCLDLWTMGEWEKLCERLDTMGNSFGEAKQLFETVYIGHAVSCQLDKQGRILIPQNLRERAKLGEIVSFVGVRNKVRIFRADSHEGLVDTYEETLTNNPDAFGGLGI